MHRPLCRLLALQTDGATSLLLALHQETPEGLQQRSLWAGAAMGTAAGEELLVPRLPTLYASASRENWKPSLDCKSSLFEPLRKEGAE